MERSRVHTLFRTHFSILAVLYAAGINAASGLNTPSILFQDSEPWCEACIVSCILMEPSFASCDKGAFFTRIHNGMLGFEVWMHAFSSLNTSIQSTFADEQRVPTAYIDAGPAFTNAVNLTVKIVLDTTCLRDGFQCASPANCDLIVTGNGVVLPSTLQGAPSGLVFSLTVALETRSQTGKVTLALTRGSCLNSLNSINRSSSAIVTIRFDRRPVSVNLWTAVSDILVEVNNVSRTVQATNKVTDLNIYLDFTHPVRNTSEELLNALISDNGIFRVLHRKSHGNRQFGFMLLSVQSPAVVTVSLDTSHVFSRAGTVVRLPSPVTFLYDLERAEVKLTPATGVKTRDRIVPVIVEFTKPVFSFNSQSLTVINGQITRLDEISKSIYVAHVFANQERVITLFVQENKTSDITGNLNAPSNIIHVRHYFTSSVSIALYSFISASFLATSFAAAVLSVSSASLAAVGALPPAAMKSIVSEPSKNLLGMAGHLQVFALSNRMAVSLPIEYSETTRGLQWLIPHIKLPWKHERRFLDLHGNQEAPDPLYELAIVDLHTAEAARGRRLGANASLYGPPLSPNEYKLYFSVRKLDSFSASNALLLDDYSGWQDFASNLFWLAAIVGALILLHLFMLVIFKWRFQSAATGALLLPRFELFLSMYALPGFCQALAFIIRGGTTTGIIVGVILLAAPAGFLLSVILFLGVAVLIGKYVQYNEVRWQANEDAWYSGAPLCGRGYKSIGMWSCKGRLPSTFLARFGLIFEDRKGPPHIVTVSGEDLKSLPQWVGSGSNGIGRMRVLNSNDDSDDMVISKDGRSFGAAQASYVIVDLGRRALIGIVFGAYNPGELSWSQLAIVFGSTVLQFLYLIIFRPYIRRGLQIVETLSLLFEAILFALGFALLASASPSEDSQAVGIVMLGLLLSTLVVQLGNEWHALMSQLLMLSPSLTPSLKLGGKMFIWGLLLPLLSKRRWSKFMPALPGQPNTGLVTVVPVSHEEDAMSPGELRTLEAKDLPYGLKAASDETGSEGGIRPDADFYAGTGRVWSQLNVPRAMQGKRSQLTATSSELKTLRELAKASFPQGSRNEDSMRDFSSAGKSFEPRSSIASPNSLLVEHRTPSASGLPGLQPTGISSEGSSADLDIVER